MKKMKRRTFRISTLIIAMALLFALSVQAAAPKTPDIQTGTFSFAGHDVNGHDLTDSYIYTDKFFDNSAYVYNEHLATMSMQLAVGSISSKATADYTMKSQNLYALLTKLGFTDFETNDRYKEQPGEQTMGAACAHKTITAADGQTYTLLAIVPRSAGYEREWAGNFTIGSASEGALHKGFTAARDQVIAFAKTYVAKHGITGNNVKVWSVGYSRGAATANLTGGLLDDEPGALESGITLDPKNVYIYTFGTPLGVPTSLQPTAEKYGNIQNAFSDYDPITMLAPAEWGFGRYGVDHYLPVYDSAVKPRMLGFLQNTSSAVYHTYTTNAGSDPDNFKPLKFQLKDGKLSVVYDDANTDADRTSQKAFLNERIRALTKAITTRDDYAANYQPMLAGFMSVYFGMSDEKYEAFNKAIGGNSLASITAGLVYATYAAGQYADHTTELQSLLIELDKQIRSDPKYGDYVKDNPTYNAITTKYLSMAAEEFAANYNGLYTELQNLTDAAIKNILTGALDAIETPTDSKDRDILLDNNVAALRKFVCDMMFSPSGDEDIESVFRVDAPPLKRAATLIGNAGSYMRVHNNEIILSWVRTEDSWYTSAGSGSGSGSAGSALPFADVAKTAWYYDDAAYVYQNGLFTGTSAATFAPDAAMTRAMLVTILWRLDGKTASGTASSFKDVASGAYYADAAAWASSNKIITGYDDGSFGPGDAITREQFAAVLYRYAKYKGDEATAASGLTSFQDAADVSQYAIPAMQWACGAKLINGSSGKLMPQSGTSRAQAAAILARFCKNTVK